MNDWKNKRCSHCLRIGHSLEHHNYTVQTVNGPIQLDNCTFITCNFCQVSRPNAPTVQRLGEIREANNG